VAASDFPLAAAGLDAYAAILLSDIGPHWLPKEFSVWSGFSPLWFNLLRWVSHAR